MFKGSIVAIVTPFRDGKVDEDYGAVSESDYYCAYVDTIRLYRVRDPESRPMGIKVWQRSFAWARGVREPIIPIEYNIICDATTDTKPYPN